MRTLRIACVHAPDFGLHLLLAQQADRGEEPVILTERDLRTGLVVMANEAAGAFDILPGMTVAQAEARAPGLRVLLRDVALEQIAARKVVRRPQS